MTTYDAAAGIHEPVFVQEMGRCVNSSRDLKSHYLLRYDQCKRTYPYEDEARECQSAIWSEFVEVHKRIYGDTYSNFTIEAEAAKQTPI